MGKFIALSIVVIVILGAVFTAGWIAGMATKPITDEDVQKLSETYQEGLQ